MKASRYFQGKKENNFPCCSPAKHSHGRELPKNIEFCLDSRGSLGERHWSKAFLQQALPLQQSQPHDLGSQCHLVLSLEINLNWDLIGQVKLHKQAPAFLKLPIIDNTYFKISLSPLINYFRLLKKQLQ